MAKATTALFAALLLSVSQAAFAQTGGNIAITGHDNELHNSTGARAQTSAMIAFARSGSAAPTLPVLAFDHGTQLTTQFTSLGIPFTRIDPDVGVPAASNFNAAVYSAMAVASDDTCGGCSNTATSITNLTAASAAIQAFLNAGGGIVAMAGALRASTYYGFLPSSAAGGGSPPSSGFVQTAFGATVGIPAVNGDITHNFFFPPGTSGVSAAYGAVEILPTATDPNQQIVTLACRTCSASGGVIIPTMPQWLFFALASMLLGGVVMALRQRAQRLA